MIEEPPLLTVAKTIERPDAALVARFAGAPTSFVADAMGGGGALDWRIKPLVGASLIGVALTCDCGPCDNLALNAAIATESSSCRARASPRRSPVSSG